MRSRAVGVVGGSLVDDQVLESARIIGRMIARNNWALVCGGRSEGVMEACSEGASSEGGLVIGILPGSSAAAASPHLTLPIITGMGDARNVIVALSSEVVIALKGKGGTLSEVALALKNNRPVVCLDFDPGPVFLEYRRSGMLVDARSPQEVIDKVRHLLRNSHSPGPVAPSFIRD